MLQRCGFLFKRSNEFLFVLRRPLGRRKLSLCTAHFRLSLALLGQSFFLAPALLTALGLALAGLFFLFLTHELCQTALHADQRIAPADALLQKLLFLGKLYSGFLHLLFIGPNFPFQPLEFALQLFNAPGERKNEAFPFGRVPTPRRNDLARGSNNNPSRARSPCRFPECNSLCKFGHEDNAAGNSLQRSFVAAFNLQQIEESCRVGSECFLVVREGPEDGRRQILLDEPDPRMLPVLLLLFLLLVLFGQPAGACRNEKAALVSQHRGNCALQMLGNINRRHQCFSALLGRLHFFARKSLPAHMLGNRFQLCVERRNLALPRGKQNTLVGKPVFPLLLLLAQLGDIRLGILHRRRSSAEVFHLRAKSGDFTGQSRKLLLFPPLRFSLQTLRCFKLHAFQRLFQLGTLPFGAGNGFDPGDKQLLVDNPLFADLRLPGLRFLLLAAEEPSFLLEPAQFYFPGLCPLPLTVDHLIYTIPVLAQLRELHIEFSDDCAVLLLFGFGKGELALFFLQLLIQFDAAVFQSPLARHNTRRLQREQRKLRFTQRGFKFIPYPCLVRLTLEHPRLLFHLHDDIGKPRHVLGSLLQLPLRRFHSCPETGNAGSFFEELAALDRLFGDKLPDLALLHDTQPPGAESDQPVEVGHISQPAGDAINEKLALTGTVEPAGELNFTGIEDSRDIKKRSRYNALQLGIGGFFDPNASVRAVFRTFRPALGKIALDLADLRFLQRFEPAFVRPDCQRDLRHTQRTAGVRTVKDKVIKTASAQLLGVGFPENPAQGVNHI